MVHLSLVFLVRGYPLATWSHWSCEATALCPFPCCHTETSRMEVAFSSFDAGTCYIARLVLNSWAKAIFLPQPPRGWDDGCTAALSEEGDLTILMTHSFIKGKAGL